MGIFLPPVVWHHLNAGLSRRSRCCWCPQRCYSSVAASGGRGGAFVMPGCLLTSPANPFARLSLSPPSDLKHTLGQLTHAEGCWHTPAAAHVSDAVWQPRALCRWGARSQSREPVALNRVKSVFNIVWKEKRENFTHQWVFIFGQLKSTCLQRPLEPLGGRT